MVLDAKSCNSVFPAHAGVIPSSADTGSTVTGFSRTRGGDPGPISESVLSTTVFPAHAGVIPGCVLLLERLQRFSRTRGGDPYELALSNGRKWFFPHTRG